MAPKTFDEIETLLNDALKEHRYRALRRSTGSSEWIRFFIQEIGEVPLQVGRVSAHKSGEFSVKDYGEKYWNDSKPDYPDDMMMALVNRIMNDASRVSEAEMRSILQKAVIFREDDLRKRKEARAILPKKKRKGLKGRNVRRLFNQFFQEH